MLGLNFIAALRYELGDNHSFEFVEGSVPSEVAPEIKATFPSQKDCFAYYDPRSTASFKAALSHLDAYIATEGPFDAVLAFSQGAALAATYVIERSKKDSAEHYVCASFKCAVFLSAGTPCDPAALVQDETRQLSHHIDGVVISVPVANIWGRNDTFWAGQSEELSKLCTTHSSAVVVHDGGHEVPGTGLMLTKAVHAIRRTVDLALFSQ